jgi:hypothetical protein
MQTDAYHAASVCGRAKNRGVLRLVEIGERDMTTRYPASG